MARISRYDFDTEISKDDMFIGTDSSGSATKNFKLEDIAKFLNSSSLISVNGQVVSKLTNNNDVEKAEFKIVGGPNFSDVTSLVFSNINSNEQNISAYFGFFQDLNILLTQSDNHNNYGHYSFVSLTTDSEAVTTTITVVFREGNGTLITDKNYAMSFMPKGQTDKSFTSGLLNFNSSNNFTHTITHNLNKFPGVTVVDSGGSNVIGEINHLSKNAFTITFKNTFSAKVHAN